MNQKIKQLIPNFIVNTFWHLPKAMVANLIYGFPAKNLTIIGVTGTSGKTSTAHLIYHLLLHANFKVALISTISAKIGQEELEIGLHVTNPDPFTLQKLLRKIKDLGFSHLVLETTSHGLDQHRVWGIHFRYGVITNLAHEHLDYHGNIQKYHQAKLKLIKHSTIAVLNQSLKSFPQAKKAATGKIISYFSGKDFQSTNNHAAQAIAIDLNISKNQINAALKTFPGIKGRMEIIQKTPFTVIIDFAHKPDALKAALTTIRQQQPKRIISVFGCAGLRDIQKRFLMGSVSAKLSDITILTAEDPRTEKVTDINDQIELGFRKAHGKNLYRIPDRQQAINQAIALAKEGDAVVLFGKAHEKSICFGTIEHPWSEHQAVQIAIKQRLNKS